MDLVTLATACAIGAGSALFMPLGMQVGCSPHSDAGAFITHDATNNAVDRWSPLIDEASRRFDIPPQWVRDVMRIESGGHELLGGEPITSPAGAMGLMQIMPDTFADLSTRYGLGNDPYDPRANIFAGAAYLRQMYDRFGAPGFFAAYNVGPNRVTEFLQGGRSLPNETLRYLAQIGDMSLITGPAPSGVVPSAPRNVGRQPPAITPNAGDSDLVVRRNADPAAAELSPVGHSPNPSTPGQPSSNAPGFSSGDGLFVALGMGGFGR